MKEVWISFFFLEIYNILINYLGVW
jgi:hypothetical protein